jgi:hypothetical protein
MDAAREKFKTLKKYCCCLVLYNYNKPLVLMDWHHIYGAMLGNIGFSVPLDIPGHPKPADTLIRTVFLIVRPVRDPRGRVADSDLNGRPLPAIFVHASGRGSIAALGSGSKTQ